MAGRASAKSSIIRIVMIITEHPRAVADVILYDLERGVTEFEGTGMYTQESRSMLFVTISRAEVRRMRDLVVQVDPAAFIVVGQGHTAYGAGFRRLRKQTDAKPAGAVLTDEGITLE